MLGVAATGNWDGHCQLMANHVRHDMKECFRADMKSEDLLGSLT
jgi:hypothetical protein